MNKLRRKRDLQDGNSPTQQKYNAGAVDDTARGRTELKWGTREAKGGKDESASCPPARPAAAAASRWELGGGQGLRWRSKRRRLCVGDGDGDGHECQLLV